MRLYRLFITGAALATAITTLSAPSAGAAQLQEGTLLAVSGTSPGNVWAVGYRGPTVSGSTTLIEHWNGTSWRVVPSPSPGTGKGRENLLFGVTAVSAADAWAVGYYASGSDPFDQTSHALIEHWNGTRWTQVTCPCSSSETGAPVLTAVTAVSRSDIWAVGDGVSRPLIVHWNGRTWSAARLPGTAEDGLTGVSAASAGSAWATGTDVTSNSALTARWNGRRWAWVRSSEPDRSRYLEAVAATSRTSAWAVGEDSRDRVTTIRWNGKRWIQGPVPQVTGPGSDLRAVTAIPGGGLWAVGYRTVKHGIYLDDAPLTARWTGARWVTVASRGFGSSDNMLNGVYASSARSAWAVGGTGLLPVIEHWNGRKWSLVKP
jgi:hypothetical protein